MLPVFFCAAMLAPCQGGETDPAPVIGPLPILQHVFERKKDPPLPAAATGLPELPRGFDVGFRAARKVSLTKPNGRGAELEYHFSSASIQLDDVPAEQWMGLMSFRDRFVLARLHEISGDLKVDMVDQIESRTRGENVAATATRSVEVRGPEPLVDRALEYLDALAAANHKQVLIDAVLVETKIDINADAEVTINAVTQEVFDVTKASLLDSADVLILPSVLVNGGATATLQSIKQVAYISDFNVEFAQDTMVVDPVVASVTIGMTFGLAPIITPGGQILLDAHLMISDLKRPIESRKVSLSRGQPLEIELPEVVQTRWTSDDLRFSPDAYGLHIRGVRIQRFGKKGELNVGELQLLLRAQIVAEEESVDSETAGSLGEVVGVDDEEGFAFVRVPSVSHGGENALVKFLRNGEEIGQGQVVEVQGGIAIVRIIEGNLKRGDQVR